MAGNSRALRNKGFMTSNEFVDKITPGLREYLTRNWGIDPDALHHPEDLFANALTYFEVARHVICDFGVAPSEEA